MSDLGIPADPPCGPPCGPQDGLGDPDPGHGQGGPPGGPPGHVLAAGAYAASFRERDPLEARAKDLPAAWRAVVQHSARTPEEKERFRQHREALGVFLGLLVAGECAKCGLGVQGLPPVQPVAGLDLQQAEIEAVAAQLYLDDTTGSVGRFPAVLGMFCVTNVTRWIRLAQEQAARPKLLKPGDRGFAHEAEAVKNREQRRAERRGNGRR